VRTRLFLLAVCSFAALRAHASQAQATPTAVVAHPSASTTVSRGTVVGAEVSCAYVDCALRLEPTTFGRRLVRGASGQVVGGFGFFHSSAIDSLLAGPDSAAANARRYKSEQHTGDLYFFAGLTAILGSAAYYSSHQDGVGFELAGVTAGWILSIPANRHYRRSELHLSRAVWWYNATLVDSLSKR